MKLVWCPVDDVTCPYYKYTVKDRGRCGMTDEDLNPMEECDAFYGMDEEEDEEECGDDYYEEYKFVLLDY